MAGQIQLKFEIDRAQPDEICTEKFVCYPILCVCQIWLHACIFLALIASVQKKIGRKKAKKITETEMAGM